ncbi:MAG: hypothetical protein GY801_52935 [bacterium]|nr:hypothetical protein [bacterium]
MTKPAEAGCRTSLMSQALSYSPHDSSCGDKALKMLGKHPELLSPGGALLLDLTATVVVYGAVATTMIAVTPQSIDMTDEEEQQAIAKAEFHHQEQQQQTDIQTDTKTKQCYPDDFGRTCQLEEIRPVNVYRLKFHGRHASLGVGGCVVGW